MHSATPIARRSRHAPLRSRWSGPPTLAVNATAGLAALGLVALAWCDLRARIIPNGIVYPALLLAAGLSPLWPERGFAEAIAGGALAFAVLGATQVLSRGGLGAGDVKMGALAGLVVGYPGVVNAGLITALSGGSVAIALLVSRGRTRSTTLTYGPLIAAASLLVLG